MLVLEDDGCGLPPGSESAGVRPDRHARKRVTALGGTLTISLHPWYPGVRQSTAALRLRGSPMFAFKARRTLRRLAINASLMRVIATGVAISC